MTGQRRIALLACVATAACGGVSYQLSDAAPPRTVAILPVGGAVDLRVRELVRSLLQSQLQERGMLLVESSFTDRVLTESGWLHDPATFDPAAVPVADACQRLHVDAVVVGTKFDESSFNVYIIRRHAFGGSLRVALADGKAWWRTDHTVSHFGGLLLQSGQVFSELAAQTAHGTPMETVALVDGFVGEVTATLPRRAQGELGKPVPMLRELTVRRQAGADAGSERIVVSAVGSADAELRFDLDDQVLGVPMRGIAGSFVGARDLPAGTTVTRVVVHARDPFGFEELQEVRE